MGIRRIGLCLLLLPPALSFAEKREVIELQRDVAHLEDQVNTLENSVLERTTALSVLSQQLLQRVNQLNTGLASVQTGARTRFQEQQRTVLDPLVAAEAKIDRIGSGLEAIRASIRAMGDSLGALQQKIDDLNSTFRTPPSAAVAADAGATGPPAGLSSASLYQHAVDDQSSGNLDLALQEFSDYVKYFGSTAEASNAQFNIGQLYYQKGDPGQAIVSLDALLQKYPDSSRVPDALYLKARSLLKLGRTAEGADTLRELMRRFPGTELADRARQELKTLSPRSDE